MTALAQLAPAYVFQAVQSFFCKELSACNEKVPKDCYKLEIICSIRFRIELFLEK